MKTIHVAAALIIQDGKLFACQRGYGNYKGWWEFPGGKIEEGETSRQAVIRECFEELGIHLKAKKIFDQVTCDYPEFRVHMDCWLCSLEHETIELYEHMNARWLSHEDLYSVKWLEADLGVLKKLEPLL